MELPSIQWGIKTQFSSDQVFIGAINSTSSETWLRNYRLSNAISYPFYFDAGNSITSLYQVGGEFSNIPPTYIIIDKNGIVRYRTDDKFNKTEEMKEKINELLIN